MASVVGRSARQWPRARAESYERIAPATTPGSDRSFDWNAALAGADDLSREVYCILGMPIDAIEMPAVMHSIDIAAANAEPFLISTPNVNFLVNSQNDPEFKESLLLSDLCPPDGMPIVWIARLMGIPIKHRISGSDIFAALKVRPRPAGPLKIFLFGAKESVAAAAARTLNATAGLRCVGWICPGWGSVDELSEQTFIDMINSSNADFLMATLGAVKGQRWLLRNHDRLQIPIRCHLGTTINFQAGTVKRAPRTIQQLGLEWLWRIKEEPYLWRRYLYDGSVLLRLTLTRVVPLAITARWLRRRCERSGHNLIIEQVHGDHSIILKLSGFAVVDHVDEVISHFRDAVTSNKQVVIDFSATRAVDARFLGLLLMLRKQLTARNAVPRFIGISRRLERMFLRFGLGYLLPARVEETTRGWNRGPANYGQLPWPAKTVSPPISPLDGEPSLSEEIFPTGSTRTERPAVRRAS
jgi:N-acetylglucosaminyldiphosphoundecaprenol N-acetyl-beta-D-mannosaminyltransferase